MKEYQKDDVAAVLQYFTDKLVPDLDVSPKVYATGHTESIRYVREYVIAHKLKLDKVRDSLAEKVLNYEDHIPLAPSPRLIEILSDAGLHSSVRYDSMIRLIARGMKSGLYRRPRSLELEDAYSRILSRWTKQDLLTLLTHIGWEQS